MMGVNIKKKKSLKKVFFTLLIVSLFFVSSCTNSSGIVDTSMAMSDKSKTESTDFPLTPNVTSGINTDPTERVSSETENSSSGNGMINEPTVKYSPDGYMLANSSNIIETKSKIILLKTPSTPSSRTPGYVCYYSKADDEFYPFCFDPLCQHNSPWDDEKYVGTTCVAKMLAPLSSSSYSGVYPVYSNSRIYFTYYSEIYSCSEYASDLRLELSFGDIYKTKTRREAMKKGMNDYYFNYFASDGNCIFFRNMDENGKIRFYRYETKKQELFDYSEIIEEYQTKTGTVIEILSVSNGRITFIASKTSPEGLVTEYLGKFLSDLKFENVSPADNKDGGIIGASLANTADGCICYESFFTSDNKLEHRNLVEISFDEIKTILVEDIDNKFATVGGGSPIYIDKEYLYFKGTSVVEIGNQLSLSGASTKQMNYCGGKLYRYNLTTGEIKCIFDDLMFDYFTLYYVNESSGEALLNVQKYTKDGDRIISRGNQLYKCSIIDGKISDLELVMLADEEDYPFWPNN